ncbi:50S ribosomal protein L9 [bacterium]|jgi:large subunit ribosomal protein L9|nr:50S ribosomal protein L9 [bacterium]MBT3850204.1 50S ribosomal protein L9 [bacterium]MBT4634168.1 50S ribosomal protein L9 [bacterium]
MKLILIKDVKKLGKEGDVVEVKDGQARNFLIPNDLAIEANTKNLNSLNTKKISEKKLELQNKEVASELAKKLKNEKITFAVKENSGKVFGSITSIAICEKLSKLGYEISRKNIDLKKPINTLGESEVKIKLYNNISTTIKVEVVPL